ncbi:MAG: methyltransferase [Thermoanaerobaculales bacterium]|nr:methyltransferase [Thermoanaerobaculales bacterium]
MTTAPSAALLLDPEVLSDHRVLEVYGWRAVEAREGLSILPRRDEWLEALGSGVEAVGLPSRVAEGEFSQAVVHLQKGRAATQEGLWTAWKNLGLGGRLLLAGGNELGIKSAVKRLAQELGQEGTLLVNRARSRVVSFDRTEHPGPEVPTSAELEVESGGDVFTLRSAIGVFSADRVDRGTRLLLDHLDAVDPPTRILDMGCGIGVLGLAALKRWPEVTAVLADVDRRAVEAATRNAVELDLEDRCRTAWWDAIQEKPPSTNCDLVLINPPFHSGKKIDLDPARAMFRSLDQVLAPRGSALIVANRTLPYERQLEGIGRIRMVLDEAGFKLLELAFG